MPGQLQGRYYGVFRLGYQYEFASLPAMLGKGAYLVAFAEAGNTWMSARDIGWQSPKVSGTLALGSSTKLGPVMFGFSMASGNNSQLFIKLGKRW